MHLFLDTSNNLQTIIKINNQNFVTNYQNPRDQNVFEALTRALNQSNIKLQDITGIFINLGPGSFTGLRVGLSIASTLSLGLNVPLNDQPPGTIFQLNYGKPPSITKPKKKT